MEIRLIAADMDGTLLDDEKGIPEENLRAFRACAAHPVSIRSQEVRITLPVRKMRIFPGHNTNHHMAYRPRNNSHYR